MVCRATKGQAKALTYKKDLQKKSHLKSGQPGRSGISLPDMIRRATQCQAKALTYRNPNFQPPATNHQPLTTKKTLPLEIRPPHLR
jgi:hypothetical protein